MSLTRQDVEAIAWLSRVDVGDDEAAGLVADLSHILEFVEQLNAAAVDDVQPMAHPLETTQRLRDDEVTECNERERFQDGAPQAEGGLYLVPRVIE